MSKFDLDKYLKDLEELVNHESDSCREGPDRSFHTVCGLFEQASLHGYETGSVSARRIGIPVRQTRPAPQGERALLFFIRCSYSCF